MGDRNREFERIGADMQKVQITNVRLTLFEMPSPPAEAVAVAQIVHSYHPLLNYHAYHTSAPSVRADFLADPRLNEATGTSPFAVAGGATGSSPFQARSLLIKAHVSIISANRESRNDDALQNQHRGFEQVPKMLESSRLASK